jgi:hypothetical protein
MRVDACVELIGLKEPRRSEPDTVPFDAVSRQHAWQDRGVGPEAADKRNKNMAVDPQSVSFLQSVPAVVWSGMIAVIGTLGGVLATNFGSTKRLRLQLEHDTSEKGKERLATLRRELYLTAADASIRANAYFGTLPQADFTKPDSDVPFRNMLAVGAQLQLVVSEGTAQLVSNLVALYAELQMKLLAKVLPIHNFRSDISIRNLHYDNAQTEIKRVLAVMAHLNESNQRDAAVFERLNASFTFFQGTAAKMADERSALWDQSNALQRQYLKDLLPEMKKIGDLQTHLLVELRRELDVGGDIEIFKRTMDVQWKRAEAAIDEFDRSFFGAPPPPPAY